MKLGTAFVLCAALACVAAIAGDEQPGDTVSLDEQESQMAEKEKKLALEEAGNDVKKATVALKDAQKTRDKQKIETAKNNLALSKKHQNRLRQIDSEEWLAKARSRMQRDSAAAMEKEQDAQFEKKLRESGPVSITGMGIVKNVINLPELVLDVRNNTSASVEAVDISAECFNKFDEPVNAIASGNVFKGTAQDKVGPSSEARMRWQLSLQGNTAYAFVYVTRVKLSDGTVWTQTKEQAKEKKVSYVKAKLMQ